MGGVGWVGGVTWVGLWRLASNSSRKLKWIHLYTDNINLDVNVLLLYMSV